MPVGPPWSVKGIDPKARAIAKTAARRQGMTLGEWLNNVILNDGPDPDGENLDRDLGSFPGFSTNTANGSKGSGKSGDGLNDTVKRLTDRLEAAENRSTQALSGVDQSMLTLTRRLESLELARDETEQTAQSALSRVREDQEELLERVRKIERHGGSGADTDVVDALENTVGKIAGRLYQTEQTFRAELDDAAHTNEQRQDTHDRAIKSLNQQLGETEKKLKTETSALREQVELRENRVRDSLNSAQELARGVQDRIAQAESATERAAEALIRSQESLDRRLSRLEGQTKNAINAEDVQKQFNMLGRELADLVRETRDDCARQIADVQLRAGDPDRLERALEAAESRLGQAEGRQSSALNRIAAEVARLSGAVDKRIAQAERRLESKLAATDSRNIRREERSDLETRLERVRSENNDAVRQIGEQVAKLGENLADRVSQAELRSAQAVEAAGERMAQVVEKIEGQRQNDNDKDLETRIRASEERTAQRIDQAMEGVHDRLDQTREETFNALSPVQRALTALADRLEAIENGSASAETQAETQADTPSFDAPLPQAPRMAPGPWNMADDDPIAAADSFVMQVEEEPGINPAAPAQTPDGWQSLDTPQAAPTQPNPAAPAPQPAHQASPKPKPAAQIGATADADFLAAARKTVRMSNPASTWADRDNNGQPGLGRMVLIGASVLGFVAVAAMAGMLVLEAVTGAPAPRTANNQVEQDPATALSELFADPGANDTRPVTEPAVSNDTAGASSSDRGTAGVQNISDTAPQPAPQPAVSSPPVPNIAIEVDPVSLEQAAAGGNAIARYQLALQQNEAGRTGDAQALMRRAAEQGIPDAMRRHAQSLLQGPNAEANRAAARAWMVRAAQNGNVMAMYNAGELFIGENDQSSQAQAVRWFEQAALHGNRDSQFNVALLYQGGFGVEASLPDAYAWLSIAARGGDSEAARRAQELSGQLTPDQRRAADQVIAGFTARQPNPSAQGNYPAQNWQTSPESITRDAQRLLAELGYNPGPVDGVMGEQTRRAIVRYQESAGLTPGGPLNSALLAQLERAAS